MANSLFLPGKKLGVCGHSGLDGLWTKSHRLSPLVSPIGSSPSNDQANCYLPVANCSYEMQRGTFEGSLAVRSISKAPRCAPLRLLGVIASPMPFLPQ